MSLLKFMRGNIMKFKVTVASTIYYQAEIEAESAESINDDIMNGEIDFTEWNEIDLESQIESIKEVNT
jgi:hypothetical protein